MSIVAVDIGNSRIKIGWFDLPPEHSREKPLCLPQPRGIFALPTADWNDTDACQLVSGNSRDHAVVDCQRQPAGCDTADKLGSTAISGAAIVARRFADCRGGGTPGARRNRSPGRRGGGERAARTAAAGDCDWRRQRHHGRSDYCRRRVSRRSDFAGNRHVGPGARRVHRSAAAQPVGRTCRRAAGIGHFDADGHSQRPVLGRGRCDARTGCANSQSKLGDRIAPAGSCF